MLSGFAIIFVVVNAGGELVLEEPEGGQDAGGDDDDAFGEGDGKRKSFIIEIIPKNARL